MFACCNSRGVRFNSHRCSTPIPSSHQNKVMNKLDLDYAHFECRKLKQKVIVTSISRPAGYSKRTGAVIHVLEAFDCNHKGVCGVLAEQGDRRIYNWRICAHPELSKQRG